MSQKTKAELRRARYNFGVTMLDVAQCEGELVAVRQKLERAKGVQQIAERVLAQALVNHGPGAGGGLPRIDERDREFAAEQRGERTGTTNDPTTEE